MSTAGPELHRRLKATPFSTLGNTGSLKAAKAPLGKRIGRFAIRATDKAERGLVRAAGKGLRFVSKHPLLSIGGAYVGSKIHQELKAEMQAMKDEGLQLGFITHAARTILKHAPRIGKTTYGAAANGLRKGKAAAKSFFNRGSAMGRAAYKVALKGVGANVLHSTPLQTGKLSGPSLARTAWRNKGKIAVGVGAGAAIHGATSVADSEPKSPISAPPLVRIRPPTPKGI